MNESTPLAESHSAEAVQAAAVHAEAIEKARDAQIRAAVTGALEKFKLDVKEEIAKGIQKNVNGRIDAMRKDLVAHNEQHEKDMRRALPVIEAYEKAKEDVETAKKGGRAVLWVAAMITAIGGAYLVLRMILFNH